MLILSHLVLPMLILGPLAHSGVLLTIINAHSWPPLQFRAPHGSF